MVNQQKPTKPIETPEEVKFRKNLFPDIKEIKNKNVLCTSCGRSVKDLVARGKPISHPFMDTLLCEKCSKFYGDGQFSEDEDGCDKYCRWCGQGGTLFLCSSCTAGFCKKCVKRNLPRSALQDIENDDWVCYCCNATPLFELRAQCWAANQYAAEHEKTDKSSSSSKSSSSKKKRGRDDSLSDEEKSKNKKKRLEDVKKNKDESKNSKEKSKHKRDESKSKSKDKSENGDESTRRKSLRDRKSSIKDFDDEVINGVKKAQWAIVIKKCEDVTSDIAKITKNMHKKLLEFRVKKVNSKHINSFETFAEVREQVDHFLTTLSEASIKVKDSFDGFCEDWIKEAKAAAETKVEENTPEPENKSIENGIVDSISQKDKDIDKDSNSTLGSPAKPTSDSSPKPTDSDILAASLDESTPKDTESNVTTTTDDLPKKANNESETNISSDITDEKMEVDSSDGLKESKDIVSKESNDNVNKESNENVNKEAPENVNSPTEEVEKQSLSIEEEKLPKNSENDKAGSESSQKEEPISTTTNEECVTPAKESPSPTPDKADSSQS